jgi:hypothetical protein
MALLSNGNFLACSNNQISLYSAKFYDEILTLKKRK